MPKILKPVLAALFCAMLLPFLAAPAAQAATAIAYDEVTGAYYYVYNYRDIKDAHTAALKGCKNRRGPNCRIIASCDKGGYGVIYRSRKANGHVVAIGAACGYGSISHANDDARATCNKMSPDGQPCSIMPFWYDEINDVHIEERCKNVLPGNDPCYAPGPEPR